MSEPLTDGEMVELGQALPAGYARFLVRRLIDEVKRLRVACDVKQEWIDKANDLIDDMRDAAANVNCERDMAEAAFKAANAELERLRAENASLKTHPEGFSAETMQAAIDCTEDYKAKLIKAVAALEYIVQRGYMGAEYVARQALKEISDEQNKRD